MSGSHKLSRIRENLVNVGLKDIVIWIDKFFPNVGIHTAYYITDKEYKGPVSIRKHGETSFHTLSPKSVFPLQLPTSTSISICDKVFGKELPTLPLQYEHTLSKYIDENPNSYPNGKYKRFFSAANGGRHVWTETKGKCHDTRKILLCMRGSIGCVFDDGTMGTEKACSWMEVSSKEEANNIRSFLETSLMRFCLKVTKSCGYFSISILRKIPLLDFTRPYTNEDVFLLFSITTEEQEYIESNL